MIHSKQTSLWYWMTSLVVLTMVVAAFSWFTLNAGYGNASHSESTQPETSAPVVIACRGHVVADPPVRYLTAQQPGIIEKVQVKVGESVDRGAVLLTLEDTLAESRVREAQAAVQAAQIQIKQINKLALRLPLQFAQQQALVEGVAHRISAAKIQINRQRELVNKRVASEADLKASSAQLKQLEAMQQAYEKQLEQLKLQDPAMDLQLAQIKKGIAEEQLKQALYAKEKTVLRAPISGTILRILAEVGQTLSGFPNQPALVFLPEGRQVVRVAVEQEFAHRVHVGQKTTIRDDANASLTWTGKVEHVDHWYGPPRKTDFSPYKYMDVRTRECTIAVDPGTPQLLLGQKVRVMIHEQ